MRSDWLKAEKVLKDGGVVVIPTDTLYGICASAFDKKAIEKIYKIKNRSKDKPLIVLISSIKDLERFGIKGNFPKIFLPKVSVLINCSDKFKYIHRGTGEIAFRMISKRNKNLFNLVNKVGPIVAPSANPENENPAETIKEARNYFKDRIDCYIDGGKKIGKPSTLIRIKKGNVEILRQGIIKINK